MLLPKLVPTNVLVLSALLVFDAGYAQLPFRRNFVTALDASPKAIRETADGGSVIMGTIIGAWPEYRDLFLVRIDPNGDTTWTRSYGTDFDEYGGDLVVTGDSGFVFAGTVFDWSNQNHSAFIVRVDSEGDIVWARSYQPMQQIEGIVQSPDGGFVVAGNTRNQPPMFYDGSALLKVDALGNVVWKRSFGVSGNQLSASSLSATSDGGYLLSATRWVSSIAEESRTVIIRTDHLGHMLWGHCFQSTNDAEYNRLTSGSAIETFEGDCVVCGAYYVEWATHSCLFIMRLTSNGDHVWNKAYPSPILGRNRHSCSSLLGMSNGDILACGSDGLILRTDSVGDVMYANSYDRFQNMSLSTAQNEEILLAGMDYVTQGQIAFARSDALGNIDCVQSNELVLAASSIVEQVDEDIVEQIPSIVAGDISFVQGWCPGTMDDCDSLDIVIPVVSVLDASSALSGIWISNSVGNRFVVNGTAKGDRLVLLDLSGKELMAIDPKDFKTVMDAFDLAPGIYIISYRRGEYLRSFRVIKAP